MKAAYASKTPKEKKDEAETIKEKKITLFFSKYEFGNKYKVPAIKQIIVTAILLRYENSFCINGNPINAPAIILTPAKAAIAFKIVESVLKLFNKLSSLDAIVTFTICYMIRQRRLQQQHPPN